MIINKYDIESLKETNVSTFLPEVKRHVVRVYSSLALTTIFSVLGVLFSLAVSTSIGFPFIGVLIAMISLIYITFSPEVTEGTIQTRFEEIKRFLVLLSFGFSEGMIISGLVGYSWQIDPSIVLTAFIGTLIVFTSLSASALLAKRKKYLYLYGFLSSSTLVLFYMGLINLFLRIEFLQSISLYGGLVVFSAYVLFDTNVIIEKVHRGSRDYVKHAAELFIDLIGLFVRILIILLKKRR